MKSRLAVSVAALLGTAVLIAAVLVLRGVIPLRWPSGTPEEPARSTEDAREPATPEGIVRLSDAQIRQFGVETAQVGPGRLRIELVLPGEVALNADRVAHVVPRVSGVVREVRKNLGDPVQRGEVMAILESRELADSTAALLAARERVNLAQSNFAREEQLWQKRISPEQDYIQAKNALAEAGIGLRTAEQKLRALGFSDDYLSRLSDRSGSAAILYEMTSPFDATIIEKHLSLGEVLRDDSPAFMIADLSSVWVNLDVHQKDLPVVQVGQTAAIGVGNAAPSAEGKITFLEPMAQETNRTVHARVLIANAGGRWRPGLFVTGRIVVDDVRVPLLVSSEALVLVGGKTCLFLREQDKFRIQVVTVGRTNGAFTEVVAGLASGQVYAAKGAFTLKSELGKPEAEK